MAACQDPDTLVRSPNTEAAIFAAATVSILLGVFLSSGNVASVDESTVAADTLQGAWNGFNLDTLIEGVAGGAAMTKGLTESAAADAAAAGEGATSMAAEGILGQLSRIISSLKYLISAP